MFLNGPDDPETPETSIRYVPQPARARLIEMFAHVDLRLIASGHVHQRRDFTWRHTRHVWAPSAGFRINDARQDRIAIKEVGLVEYRFQPDSFVRSATSGRPARSMSTSRSCSPRWAASTSSPAGVQATLLRSCWIAASKDCSASLFTGLAPVLAG
jgi:hypothetical protein